MKLIKTNLLVTVICLFTSGHAFNQATFSDSLFFRNGDAIAVDIKHVRTNLISYSSANKRNKDVRHSVLKNKLNAYKKGDEMILFAYNDKIMTPNKAKAIVVGITGSLISLIALIILAGN